MVTIPPYENPNPNSKIDIIIPMAHKSLSKNRKRKAMIRNANPGLFPIKPNLKPPSFAAGGIVHNFMIDECMEDFFNRANAIHESILSSLKGADPKQFAMAYNNEAGTIGVIFAPKTINVKLAETPYSKYLIENNREILQRNTGVVVGMDLATELDKVYHQPKY
jgi:hypothetical protein